jgi:trk system potassium uptake protein TrkH
MQSYYPVVRVLSLVILMFGLTMLLPLGVSWWLDDGAFASFDEAFLLTVATGAGLWYATRSETRDLTVRDGFLMVALVWTLLPVYAALPLVLELKLSFTDAYFEAVSGLTTTGATVLSGLDDMPVSINLWRTQMVWLGGMGLIVLAVAILPLLGIGGRQMFKAETPGPMKDTKMTPRIAETAKGLWIVYSLLSICCALAYYWAGMSAQDAIMHMFATMGLGGFSSHDASFAYFASPTIEAVAIAFMLFAGMNFATHFRSLLRAFAAPLPVGPGSRLVSAGDAWQCPWHRRLSRFSTTSIRASPRPCAMPRSMSSRSPRRPASRPPTMPCGRSSHRCGCCSCAAFATSAGSTGGGIKMIRALVLYKQVYRELMRAMHPNAVHPVKIGNDVCRRTFSSRCSPSALCTWSASSAMTLLLSFSGLEIITAFSAVVASINNTGPGSGQVGPASNFAGLSDFQTWVCTFAMLLGRLEIFTLLVVMTPAFWRK